jgi:hypothetical protein
MLAFAEDAEFIDSKAAVVQQAVDQVGDSRTTITTCSVLLYSTMHACIVM